MENSDNRTKKQLLKEIEELKKDVVRLSSDTKNNLFVNKLFGQKKSEHTKSNHQESEDIFKLITENTSDLISLHTFDLKASYEYLSPSVKTITGYESESLIGKSAVDYIHPDDARYLLIVLKRYLNKKIRHIIAKNQSLFTEKIEYRFKHKSGKWHFFQSTANIIGKRLLFVSRDITNHKQTELNLVKSENKYKTLFEKSADAILLIKDGKFIDCNQATVSMLGYSNKKDFLNTHPSELSPERQPDGLNSIEKANYMMSIAHKQGSHRFEWNHKKQNGEIFPVEVLLTAIPGQKDDILHVVWRDITNRKISENTIKESNERYRRLSEAAFEGIMIHINGKIIDVNQTCANLFGYEVSEMIGMNALELSAPETRDIIRQNIKNKYELPYKAIGLRKDGTTFPGELIGKPMPYQGQIARVAIIRDITEQIKAEKELQKSEKMLNLFFSQSLDGFFFMMLDKPVEWNDNIDKNKTLDYVFSHQRVTKANEAVVEQYNMTKETFIGLTPGDLFSHDLEYGRKIWREFFDKGKLNIETNERKADNSPMIIEGDYTCLYDSQNRIIGHFGIQRDITSKKRSEQAQKALYNISNAVITTDNLNNLLRIIQKELGAIIDTTNFYIAFYDKDTDSFSLPFFADEKDKYTSFPAKQTLTYQVIKNKKPLLATKEVVSKLEKAGEISSIGSNSKIWLGVPMTIDEKTKGVLAVQSYTDEFAYNESDLEILEFIGNHLSISIERKKSEDALRVSEKKYRSLIETAPEGFWLIDNDQKTIDVNNSLCNMLEYSNKEILGKTPSELMDDDNYKIFLSQNSGEVGSNQLSFEISLKNKSGKNIPTLFNVTSQYDTKGKIIGSFAFITNISEHKKAEELIKKSEERFDLAMQASKDGLYDWNLVTNKIYFSSSWKNLLGYNGDELKNDISVWKSLTHPEEREQSLIKLKESIAKKIPYYNVEFRMKHKKGHWVDILSSAELIYDENGKCIRVVGTHKDMTEFKKSETELRIALKKATESDRLKSAFLATMSHELRTPLNAIIGFSDIINKELPINEIIDYNNNINTSGNHLLSIIEDLFDITLIESGEVKIIKEDFDPNIILTDVLKIILSERKRINKEEISINLDTNSEGKDLLINSDKSKIKQILINLLKNALKFTDKGYVRFGYSLETQNNEPFLKFYIKDTGIGIPKDKQKLIFDIFRQAEETNTRKYGGTGIGLSVSKKLTKLLGGEIWLESNDEDSSGKNSTGSTFYFTIPANKSINIIPDNVSINKIETDKKLILIAEDDISSMEFIKILLKIKNFESIGVANGEEAINICKENPDIDLILMDINMPVIDGYTATKEIKKFRPDLPIIAQTAYAIAGDREKALKAGCNDYISKPIKKDELIKSINNLLKVQILHTN